MTSTKRSSRAWSRRAVDDRNEGDSLVILGVDPGTFVTGYGSIRVDDGEVTAVSWGVIRARKADPIPRRLLTIHEALIELIDTVEPRLIAVERAFYGKNVRSLIAMGQSVGVTLLASAEKGIEAVEYTPREVKKAVAGRGGASKEQVQRMVYAILGLKPTDAPLDATDALAVALCQENRMRDIRVMGERGRRSGGKGRP